MNEEHRDVKAAREFHNSGHPEGFVSALAWFRYQAREEARLEERARIVAWLRGPATSQGDMRNAAWCADAIERGEAGR